MRSTHLARVGSGWPAARALIERWSELPARSWCMLLTVEANEHAEAARRAPDSIERWLIRDLVNTAWAMANHRSPTIDDDWTDQARAALERLAWRVVSRQQVDTPATHELVRPSRSLSSE